MKKKAIFIPVLDETFFVHKWLEYYSRHFDKSDMYVLYYGKDREYEIIFKDVNLIRVNDLDVVNYNDQIVDIYNKNWETHAELLTKYEYVMMAEADEFLWHPMGVGNYIDSLDQDYVTCKGYELIHMKDVEPPFDPSKKIVEQRSFWYNDPVYFTKTLITTKILSWNIGNHRMNDHPKKMDENLLLIHMHKYDYDIVKSKHYKFAKMKWSEKSLDKNTCWHYRITDEDTFYKWFYVPDHLFALHNLPTDSFVTERIPENIKKDLSI